MSTPAQPLPAQAPAAATGARGWITRGQATCAFVLALIVAWPLLPDFTVVVASYIALYSLVALGFVLIYKSAGVPNLAQGALVMTAGYAVWLVMSWGLSVWIAIPIAAAIMFGFGLVVERLLLRRMVGQPVIMVVMPVSVSPSMIAH